MANSIDPLFAKSFVGIWKRMFVSGRPDHDLHFLIFNDRNGKCTFDGSIGPANRKLKGDVIELRPNPGDPDRGLLVVKGNGRRVEWSYTLNRNNDFKKQFSPFPRTSKTPPVLNELLLVGQGTRQLYAFFSYPFKAQIWEEDIIHMVP